MTCDRQERPDRQGEPAWDEDPLVDHHIEEVLRSISDLATGRLETGG